MKFKAEAADLDLELTLLSKTVDGECVPGEVILLSPKLLMNVKNVERIVRDWSLLEKKRKPKKKKPKAEKDAGKNSAKAVIDYLDAEAEDKADDEDEVDFPFETIAIELSMVYDRPKEWWLENFDISTLNDIMKFVGQGIANVKKKPGKSKQSSRSDTTESE